MSYTDLLNILQLGEVQLNPPGGKIRFYNGPQYSSDQFAAFTREWEFQHTTSSPLHSQSNGKAEPAVKIAKNLVKKAKRENKDLQMALLEW